MRHASQELPVGPEFSRSSLGTFANYPAPIEIGKVGQVQELGRSLVPSGLILG